MKDFFYAQIFIVSLFHNMFHFEGTTHEFHTHFYYFDFFYKLKKYMLENILQSKCLNFFWILKYIFSKIYTWIYLNFLKNILEKNMF
jgi:hypothetical protein